MISARYLQNVFKIRCGEVCGTGFLLDHLGQELLVTARHLVEAYPTQAIEVSRNKGWHSLSIEPLPNPHVECDVVAMRLIGCRLSWSDLKMPRADRIVIGQEVFFLGFPLGLYTDGESDNNRYPIALAKRGICSGIFGEGPTQKLYVDAMNTKGCSGAPLLCAMDNQDLSVIGVVSGYEHRGIKAPIIGGGQVFARIEENVGITTAFLLMGAFEAVV